MRGKESPEFLSMREENFQAVTLRFFKTPPDLYPPLGGIKPGLFLKIRNVTARKFSSLMAKNSGLSLPRTAQSPREDPNRGVGGPGQPLGKGRPGHRVGAASHSKRGGAG